MCADILAFCETKTLISDTVQIPGFRILNRNDSPSMTSSIGTLVFQNNNFSHNKIRNLQTWQEGNQEKHIQVVSWEQKGVTLYMIYRSPSSQIASFKALLKGILVETVNKPTTIFGDFNINFLDKESVYYKKMFKDFGFAQNTPLEASTDGNTSIDVCFSNIVGMEASYYESYFSYHKPVCISWPKFDPVLIDKDKIAILNCENYNIKVHPKILKEIFVPKVSKQFPDNIEKVASGINSMCKNKELTSCLTMKDNNNNRNSNYDNTLPSTSPQLRSNPAVNDELLPVQHS
jgi:hypothetical protein